MQQDSVTDAAPGHLYAGLINISIPDWLGVLWAGLHFGPSLVRRRKKRTIQKKRKKSFSTYRDPSSNDDFITFYICNVHNLIFLQVYLRITLSLYNNILCMCILWTEINLNCLLI